MFVDLAIDEARLGHIPDAMINKVLASVMRQRMVKESGCQKDVVCEADGEPGANVDTICNLVEALDIGQYPPVLARGLDFCCLI